MRLSNQKVFIIILTIMSTIIMAQDNDSITLATAVKNIIDNSSVLRSARDGESAAEARTGSAYSNYFPSISGTATFSNISPVTKFTLPLTIPPDTTPKMVTFQFNAENNYDAHIGAEYLLYDFGRRHTILKTSHLGEQGAKVRSSSIRNAIAFQAVSLFSSLLIQEMIIKEKRVDSLTLERHLDFIKKKMENGSATEFDVLGTQVQLTFTQGELNNLNNDFIKNKIEFCELSGLSQDKIHFKGSFDSTYHAVSTDSLLTSAVNNRYELAGLKISEQAASMQLLLAKKEMAPSIVAKTNAGFKNGYSPEINNPTFNWSAGAALQAPIFDGYKSKYHKKEAEVRLDSLKQISKDILQRIRIEILKGVQDVKAEYTNMIISETNVLFANEAFRIASIQYESGTVTNLNVLDAETKLSQAKLVRLQSEYRYTMSQYLLWRAAGYDFSKGKEIVNN
jgi:outer membrane protein